MDNFHQIWSQNSRLQVMWCTAEIYCLLHVVVQGPGSFRGPVNFRILAYFPHTKPPKHTFQWPAQGLHRRMLPIFPCGRRRSKGVPSGSGVFLRLLLKELGTPKLANIFAYVKWLYPYRMQLHGVSDLDQRCLKTRNSEDWCTFPPNIVAARYPQNHPKTPLGGDISMQNLLYK